MKKRLKLFTILITIFTIIFMSYNSNIIESISRTSIFSFLNNNNNDYFSDEIQLIIPKYETNDTIVADYVINPSYGNGLVDASNAIQNAINTCNNNGGGTIWLPEGKYLISKTISLRSGCTLRGEYQNPDSINNKEELKYGTIIIVSDNFSYESPEASINGATSVFKMDTDSGAIGLTVYFKNQNLSNIVQNNNPYTFYLNAFHHNATVKNVTIINGYRGIGTLVNYSHGSFTLKNVKGTLIKTGISLNTFYEMGVIDGVVFDPKYWSEANLSIFDDNITNPSSEEIINLMNSIDSYGVYITDVEQYQYSNISLNGYKYGIYFPSNEEAGVSRPLGGSGNIYDLNITNAQYGIYVRGESYGNQVVYETVDDVTRGKTIDPAWGYNLSNSNINASQYAIYNDSPVVIRNIANDNYKISGTFKLFNVNLNGGRVFSKTISSDSNLIYNDNNVVYSTSDYINSSKNLDYKIDTYKITKTTKNNLIIVDSNANDEFIQEKINELSNLGGGVLYLKHGIYYNIDSTIVIPKNVEVRGSSSISNRSLGNRFTSPGFGINYENGKDILQNSTDGPTVSYGTIIALGYNSNIDINFSVFQLQGDNSGVSGISIINLRNIKKYNEVSINNPDEANKLLNENEPAVISSVNAKDVYINNVTIIASMRGIDLSNCDNHYISSFGSGVLYYPIIINNSDNGIITNVLHNSNSFIGANGYFYVQKMMDYDDNGNMFNTYQKYMIEELSKFVTKENTVLIHANNTKNEKIFNSFGYGLNIFTAVYSSYDLLAINSDVDNMDVDGKLFVLFKFGEDNGNPYSTIINSMQIRGYDLLNHDQSRIKVNRFNNFYHLNGYVETVLDTDNSVIETNNDYDSGKYRNPTHISIDQRNNIKIYNKIGTIYYSTDKLDSSNYQNSYTSIEELKKNLNISNTVDIYYYIPEIDNYYEGTGCFQLNIYDPNKKKPSFKIKDGLSYGNTSDWLIISDLDGDVYFSLARELNSSNYLQDGTKGIFDISLLDAGNYTLYYYVPNNYTIEQSGNIPFTIERKIIEANFNSPENKTYNGSNQISEITCPEGSITSGTTSEINAGSYIQTCTLDSKNYKWSDGTLEEKNIGWKILPKEVSVTWENKNTFTYNGKEQAPDAYINSGIDGETINISRTAGINVGNYTSTASCSSVTGGQAKCENYIFTNNTKNYMISQNTNQYTRNKVIKSITKAQSIIDEYKNEKVKIYDNNNNLISDLNKNIGTGYKIEVTNSNEINRYSVVLIGDITGDGNINVGDVAKLYSHIRKRKEIIKEEELLASDVVEDNKILINDVAKLYSIIRSNY